MQTALFIANAIVIYLATTLLLGAIESRRGSPLPNRQIIFFIIFFALILVSFELLKLFFGDSS